MSTTIDKKVYFITGGGTGGHIYPAVAICQALMADDEKCKIYYVGNPENIEYGIVKNLGIEFLPVKVSGMPRHLGLDFIKWFFELFLAWVQSLKYIKKYKPNAVLGTGGYVSAPILLACASGVVGRVKYMIHDCDSKPGLVSRLVAPHAEVVSLAFSSAEKFLNNKNCIVNGNPIRTAFKTMTKESARKSLGLMEKMTLCIMGGSQGAKSINEAAVPILKKLSQKNVQVIFQTGVKKFEDVNSKLNENYPEYEADKNLVIRPYFDNMDEVLKSSDVAVSRSGSLSLSEICACSVAPILVPYPYAAADHQRINAKFMCKKGSAQYLEDTEITPELLLEKINNYIEDEKYLIEVQQNAYKLAKLDSTQDILKQLKSLI